MVNLIFKPKDINYSLLLYGKRDYLIRLYQINYNKQLRYIENGNWVLPNQNKLVQFIVSFGIDLQWDDDYIYNYIKSNYSRVGSLMGFTSLYNRGESFKNILFPESNHETLIVLPFNTGRDKDYYFETKLEDLVYLKTLYTTDLRQRWDITLLTSENKPTIQNNYTIVELDPFALLIGYVRYIRDRISNDRILGLTPHSFVTKYPIANFYLQHNFIVNLNYINSETIPFDTDKPKWNMIPYERWVKEMSQFLYYSISSQSIKNLLHYLNTITQLNSNLINQSIFPDNKLSIKFTQLVWVYEYNTMNLSVMYLRYLKFLGKTDEEFSSLIKSFLIGDVRSLTRPINNVLWRNHYIGLFMELKRLTA